MIRVDIEFDEGGCLSLLTVRGHDKAASGKESLVCGIVSAFSRTAAMLVEAADGISWRGQADKPGELYLSIQDYPAEMKDWLRGITEFVLKGMGDLHKESPDSLFVQTRRG